MTIKLVVDALGLEWVHPVVIFPCVFQLCDLRIQVAKTLVVNLRDGTVGLGVFSKLFNVCRCSVGVGQDFAEVGFKVSDWVQVSLDLSRCEVSGLSQVFIRKTELLLQRQGANNLVVVGLNVLSPEHLVNNLVCRVVVVLVYGVEHLFFGAREVGQLLSVVAIVTAKLDRSACFVKGQLLVGKDVGDPCFGIVGKPGFVRVEHVFAQSLLQAIFSYARVVGVFEARKHTLCSWCNSRVRNAELLVDLRSSRLPESLTLSIVNRRAKLVAPVVHAFSVGVAT